MTRLLKIDEFIDFVCPWCLVGSARLDKAIAALPDDIDVVVEHHPFYLDNNIPDEGVVVADKLREKYGKDPRKMWERVENEAIKSGITLNIGDAFRRWPTTKAHTITRLAPLGSQHALANAITNAYFLEHRKINDDDVLADIAVAYGFNRGEAIDAMNDETELALTGRLAGNAAAQGISGVPYFVFGEKYALSGAQPDEVFASALQQVISEI